MLAGVGLAVVTKGKVLSRSMNWWKRASWTWEEAAAMSDKIVAEGKADREGTRGSE